MQIQRRSSSCIAKIVALVAMLLAVFALIAVLLNISPNGVPLPTIDLSRNAWCMIAVVALMVVALLGLGVNAKRRDDNR